MNYFSFMLLSQQDKMQEIWKNGTLIAERQEGLYQYELYQLENFYAEKQSHLLLNTSEVAKTFTAPCYLEPWLKSINISDIAYLFR
ncbi:MAG: hypothetical protein QM764_23865 [Chitinophagaceae bacterium]